MTTSTLTSKGQITLPKEIREHLRLRIGHKVEFLVDRAGNVVLRPRNHDIRALKGIVRSRRRRPVSVGEMNEEIAKGYAHT